MRGLEPAATGGSSVTGVIGKDDTGRRWSIGELARASGLTVRALRHYDEIGLLTAGERTASGHRRYTERDLRRLYRVRALRTLGLSLEEIAGVLADPADDLTAMGELLAAQLRGLEAQAERVERLTHQVRGLLRQIENASMPDPDQFMTTLEMISVFETSFTPEQRERLAERRAELGPDAVEAARTEWAGLVEELLAHVRDDTPPGDPRVRALVRRWDALGNLFHGGDDRTVTAARTMWKENSEELGGSLPWPADRMRDLVGYLERARQA
jgi:MerR family transcriptional regulator, thiopeptide resistance regulator